jgi:tRNA dimethylallyltransferase
MTRVSNEPHKAWCAEAVASWFVTGATATGKTDVGLALAERLDAEIISLDSMAIYRGMDIGTAKPTAAQRARVPHHLLDIRDPIEEFSVWQYCDAALAAMRDIRGRGRQVVFVGGTALYLKALLRGVFHGPPADWEFRREVESELATAGQEALHERLRMVDPVAAHRLHPHDTRRIIRALEVYRLTGRPISHWQNEFEEGRAAEECRVFALRYPRDELHRRIERRVAEMFRRGLVDEVRGLVDRWGQLGRTAAQAVGYREVLAHLAGADDEEATIEAVEIRTRQFARHQETWFRGLSECRLVDIDAPTGADDLADRMVAAVSRR